MPSYYLSEDLARFGEMARTHPKLFDLFNKWYGATMEKGALDVKAKKPIALAVAFAIQEPYCIDAYTSACADAGVSPEEMAEAVSSGRRATVARGPSRCRPGSPTWRRSWKGKGGGEGGIRTHVGLFRPQPAFEAGPL